MSSDCIFCKIIAGEMPAATVYEDESTIAFLDISPITRGHTLVVPREHCETILDAPDASLKETILAVAGVARAMKTALGAVAVSVTQANGELAGQVVPHVHFHVIPRCPEDPRAACWDSGKYESQGEMEAIAETLRSALAQQQPGGHRGRIDA